MSQCPVVESLPGAQDHTSETERESLPFALLFLLGEQMLQGMVEERQLNSVIRQIFRNPRARQKLVEDPDTFIARLKVLPRVKAILGLMKATLLAQKVVDPQFSWWWGRQPPPDEEESTSSPIGSPVPSAGMQALLPALG